VSETDSMEGQQRMSSAGSDLSGGDDPAPIWRDPDRPLEERVEALLAALTLPEKVAQLSSAWEDVEPSGPDVAPGTSLLGTVGPLEQTAEHGLGQLTRPYGTLVGDALDHARRLARRQRHVVALQRLGVPAMAHDECLTGVTAYGATIYPTPLGLSATFAPELIGQVGAAIGADLAEAGVHQGLAPVLDVIRDYRWGRCEETFGEDPFLVGEMGEAYVLGLQGQGVIATLKHFAGYAASVAGRNHAPVHVGRRELTDVVLAPFERVVAAGAESVMNSYAEVDGVAPAVDRWLLTTLLRDTWRFRGTVVSDYWAIPFLVSAHRVAADWREAGALALRAGLDVELPDQRGFGPALVSSVLEGSVGEDVVDRAVRRVLRQKINLGLLDPGWTPEPPGLRAGRLELDKPANRELARSVAEAGAVLLRNEGILPLPTSGRVAVIGPCADNARTMFGCYSFPNHVLAERPELGIGVAAPSFREALAGELPGVEWTFAQGCHIRDPDRSGIARAAQVADAADLVILFVGDQPGMFGSGTSGEGCDVEDLRLPGVQADLVNAVLATGRPTVLVVNSGRPYALSGFEAAQATVQVFLPGEEGGPALAGLLSGRSNFSGKLPVQIPASAAIQPHTYLHAPLGGRQTALSNLDPTPAYPFGHGLSYTTFRIHKLRTSATAVPCDGYFSVSVDVDNTGIRRGAEVVQLYVTDVLAQVTRPARSLFAFAKIHLDPGESTTVVFDVDAQRYAFCGLDERLVVEPGTLSIAVGSSSADLPVSLEIELTGPPRFHARRTVFAVPHHEVRPTPPTMHDPA
jgi:beta-xylosidase